MAFDGPQNRDPSLYHLVSDDGSIAVLEWRPSKDYRTKFEIPSRSLPGFWQDMRQDYSDLPLSGVAELDAIINGDAPFIGKGDDGLVFDLGDGRVVKLYSTVPYHADNQWHRTPEKAAQRGMDEFNAHQALAGVACVPDIEAFQHAGRTWLVKPKLETTETPTQEQYDAVAECLRQIHRAGWSVNDRIEVGLDANGDPFIFDLGKATPGADQRMREDDRDHLAWWPARDTVVTDRSLAMTTEDLEAKAAHSVEMARGWLDPDYPKACWPEVEEALALTKAAALRVMRERGPKASKPLRKLHDDLKRDYEAICG